MTNVEVAIKVEPSHTIAPRLQREIELYQRIHLGRSHVQKNGIPDLYDYGDDFGYKYEVLQLLGMSLGDMVTSAVELKLDSSTIFNSIISITTQLLTVLESLHARGFIHGNISSETVLIGRPGSKHPTYLIDFSDFKTLRATNVRNGSHVGPDRLITEDLRSVWKMMVTMMSKNEKKRWPGFFIRPKKESAGEHLLQDTEQNVLLDNIDKKIVHELKMFWDQCGSLKDWKRPDYTQLKSLLQVMYWKMNGTFMPQDIPDSMEINVQPGTNITADDSESSRRSTISSARETFNKFRDRLFSTVVQVDVSP